MGCEEGLSPATGSSWSPSLLALSSCLSTSSARGNEIHGSKYFSLHLCVIFSPPLYFFSVLVVYFFSSLIFFLCSSFFCSSCNIFPPLCLLSSPPQRDTDSLPILQSVEHLGGRNCGRIHLSYLLLCNNSRYWYPFSSLYHCTSFITDLALSGSIILQCYKFTS